MFISLSILLPTASFAAPGQPPFTDASGGPFTGAPPEEPARTYFQPYALNPFLDAALLTGIMAMKSHSGSRLQATRSAPLDLERLDSRQIPIFDRWAIGFHSSSLSAASSGLAWSQFLIPLAVNALDISRGRQPWHAALTDAVILQEALMLSTSLSSYAKSFRIHSTPLSYDPKIGADEKRIPQNASSFFSNHTATAFTTAVFSGYTFQARHPGSPLVPWVWGTGLTMATGVGALRILAGKHFPSDVLAGAAVGAFCGYLVPRLHMRVAAYGNRESRPRTDPGTGRPLALPEKKTYDLNLGMSFPGGSSLPVPTLTVNF